jgi:hypothetical protein
MESGGGNDLKFLLASDTSVAVQYMGNKDCVADIIKLW